MNKLILLATAAVTGALNMAPMPANPPVDLQPTSPGTVQSGNLNIDGTATVGLLKSQGTVFGQSTAPTGFAYGGFFTAASNQGRGFYGFASSPTGLTYGGFFQNASESGRAVYGLATSTTGFNYGGYFQSASVNGRGILGVGASTSGVNYGVYGVSSSPTGFGLYSQGNVGIAGNLGIGTGTGVPGHRLEVKESTGVWGLGTVRVANGIPSPASGNNANRALWIQSSGPSGTEGVAAQAQSTDGGYSYAVSGYANGAGVNIGVRGQSNAGSSNYGGYFDGLLYASSSSAGVKSFMIDHPLDPANKVLSHSSVESDERLDIYRGTVKTDSKGYAWVVVPDWFSALNKDVQYQLTVIDSGDSDEFVLAKVVSRLRDQQFRIRTSKPRTEVNWLLTGVRHDPTSNAYPLQVERWKNDGERGKYFEPRAYGKDESLGIGYVPVSELSGSRPIPTGTR